MKYNNNPKNRRRFLEFQRRQLELSRQTENEARKLKIESNLDRWENHLPDTLKLAKPANLSKKTIEKIKEVNLKPPYTKRIVINSKHSASGTFTAYVILYALLKGGIVTPSEIKTTSLIDGYNNINGMFNSREWKENFFNKDAKVLLIEGSSKSLTSLAPRGEDQFWKELAEFTRNEQRLVIITYSMDESESEKEVFIPEFTNDRELNTDLVMMSSFIRLSDEEEEKIKSEQAKAY